MKYALRDGSGKTVNILDATINNLMRTLELTREEAVQVYLSDNDIEADETIAELTAKAKTAGAGAKATGERVVRKAPERKPDMIKRAIVGQIGYFLGVTVGVSELEITNIERMIAFDYAGDKYEVTLTKKRVPKK